MLGRFVKPLQQTLPKMLQQNPQEVVQSLERERFWVRTALYNKTNPSAKFIFAGAGALSFVLALYARLDRSQAESEIDFRKRQLDQPVAELSDGNSTTIPWSHVSVKDWQYRPVRITGRPIHSRAMLIPTISFGLKGYEYVVPLVTRENKDGTEQEGVLLSKGFIPAEYGPVAQRYKLENAYPQTFVAYVGKLDELADHAALGEGNCPDQARNKWSHVNLKDMALQSGLKNPDLVKSCVLEAVNLETPLDERDMHVRDISSDYREDYPYKKTRSGALQLSQMPWDFERKFRYYSSFGLISTGISLLLFFAK